MVTVYWTTGIQMRSVDEAHWAAFLHFQDGGPSDPAQSTRGRLETSYTFPTIEEAARLLKADAAQLGIEFRMNFLYMEQDGDSKEFPPPAGWRQMLRQAAAELGMDYGYPWDAETSLSGASPEALQQTSTISNAADQTRATNAALSKLVGFVAREKEQESETLKALARSLRGDDQEVPGCQE